MAESNLILTLAMDEASRSYFETLRRQHFPPKRNQVPAHLSLFNQLPGEQLGSLETELAAACSERASFDLRAEKLRMLGHGVAFILRSPELKALRGRLAESWEPWLGPQDRQGFQPHVTVQNKVAPERAKALHVELAAGFEPFAVRAEGLLLWRYLGGPWELVNEYGFGE